MSGESLECPTCSNFLTIPPASTLAAALETIAAGTDSQTEATCWQWLAPQSDGNVVAEIKFSCPECAQHIGAPDNMAGESLACPNCEHQLQIPAMKAMAVRPRTLVKTMRQPKPPAPGQETEPVDTDDPEIGGLSCFELTDIGRHRETNEDSVMSLPSQGLFCVADGMGGLCDGRMASITVVEAVRTALDDDGNDSKRGQTPEERVMHMLQNANRLIRGRSLSRGAISGSTAVAMVFDRGDRSKVRILHAGDSRAYRWRNHKLERLTTDHTVAGVFGTEEDMVAPVFRGKLMRAVGIKDSLEVESTLADSKPGDIFMLCSDGVSRMLTDAMLTDLFDQHGHDGLPELGRLLVDGANERGGIDNISVILVRVS